MATTHRIPAQLYDLALEHAASILHLIDTCRYASAFALVRCEFECFVRGAWIHHRATDEEIEQFVEKDEIKPKIWQLIEALEQHPPFDDTILSNAKEMAWKRMNGYKDWKNVASGKEWAGRVDTGGRRHLPQIQRETKK